MVARVDLHTPTRHHRMMVTPSIPAIPPPSGADSVEVDLHRAIAEHDRLWSFRDEYVLGTRLEVLVNSQDATLAKAAATVARREIERLNRVLNHRLETSELAQLNRDGTVQAGADLFAVVKTAEAWRLITRGAFDGRMGMLLRLWAAVTAPVRTAIDNALNELKESTVALDANTKRIGISPRTVLSLDAVAKGYIIDAAITAARRAVPSLQGIAVNIGGDIRCWGESPQCPGWRVGIPDPLIPAENSPLVDAVLLKDAAIATSGRGPRDCIGDRFRSSTLSPFTGRPVTEVISASVVASHAADADAVATACMVLNPLQSIALVESLEGVAARITDATGKVFRSAGWPAIHFAAAAAQDAGKSGRKPSLPPEQRWPSDWELAMTYRAPDRQEERNADFRTPYMVMWITDMENRPVRTIIMVGTSAEWQRDNYIWWASHRERAAQLVDLRSQATALSGRYSIYWPGLDDNWQPVPVGKYILHLETSQERGKHNHRSMIIEVGRERFKTQLPNLKESGGLDISYGHYNDRFNAAE